MELVSIADLPKSKRPNETQLHEQFLSYVFVKAFGYQKREAGTSGWSIESECVTDVDKTRPDGVLGFLGGDNRCDGV